MPWAELLTAWAVFTANILTPGPNVFNTIAIALGSGRRVAMAVPPAILIGVWGWALAATLGASALFRAFPWAQPALTALGGGLLLWFATRSTRRALTWRVEGLGRGREIGAKRAFWQTLGILATNPKAMTTWLVLMTIFPAGEASGPAIAVMVLGSGLLAALGHTGYALIFSTRAAALAYARAGGWINGGVAVFFAAIGCLLLAEAIATIWS